MLSKLTIQYNLDVAITFDKCSSWAITDEAQAEDGDNTLIDPDSIIQNFIQFYNKWA